MQLFGVTVILILLEMSIEIIFSNIGVSVENVPPLFL